MRHPAVLAVEVPNAFRQVVEVVKILHLGHQAGSHHQHDYG